MDQVVKGPLGFARAIPEVNGGIRVLSEELLRAHTTDSE